MIQVNKTTIPSLNSDSGYFVNSFNEMIIESGEKVPFENKRIADEIIDNGLIAYQKIINACLVRNCSIIIEKTSTMQSQTIALTTANVVRV